MYNDYEIFKFDIIDTFYNEYKENIINLYKFKIRLYKIFYYFKFFRIFYKVKNIKIWRKVK